MWDILGLDSLFAEMTLGIGLALIIGNGFALYKHRRGERPDGMETAAEIRLGRVVFLVVVGALMAVWAALSIFTR